MKVSREDQEKIKHYTYLAIISQQIVWKKINIMRAIKLIQFSPVSCFVWTLLEIWSLEKKKKVNFYGRKCDLGLDGSIRLDCTIKEVWVLNEKIQNGWVSGNRIVPNCWDSSQIKAGVGAWARNVHFLETTSTISIVRRGLALSCKCNGFGLDFCSGVDFECSVKPGHK